LQAIAPACFEKRAESLTHKDADMALITGGNSGIGLATAKQFVNEGAYVFISGRRDKELAAAVKEIGKNATGIQGDVSNLGDLDRLFARIKREKGKLILCSRMPVSRSMPRWAR
jgi:NAD(P)-dependent dehydrogenase (short-subunit alcohol dehydrogenase family)